MALLVLAAVPSCDKISKAASGVKRAIDDKISSKQKEDTGDIDPAWKKLMDQTPEGYLFRRDLPFPSHIEITVSARRFFKGRWTRPGISAPEVVVRDETVVTLKTLKRDQETVTAEIFPAEIIPTGTDPKKADEASKNAAKPKAGKVPAETLAFHQSAKGWSYHSNGRFAGEVIGRELAEHLPEILSEEGLAPRAFWFGTRRLNVGQTVELTGDNLKMLFPGGTSGNISLKLNSIRCFKSHPCGVFSISGEVNTASVVSFDERDAHQEKVSIESGEVWLSLIHPLVLKEDYQAIVTTTGGPAESQARGQGTMNVLVERDWKAAADDGK